MPGAMNKNTNKRVWLNLDAQSRNVAGVGIIIRSVDYVRPSGNLQQEYQRRSLIMNISREEEETKGNQNSSFGLGEDLLLCQVQIKHNWARNAVEDELSGKIAVMFNAHGTPEGGGIGEGWLSVLPATYLSHARGYRYLSWPCSE